MLRMGSGWSESDVATPDFFPFARTTDGELEADMVMR